MIRQFRPPSTDGLSAILANTLSSDKNTLPKELIESALDLDYIIDHPGRVQSREQEKKTGSDVFTYFWGKEGGEEGGSSH